MHQVMNDFDTQGQDEIGPSRYSSYHGETVPQVGNLRPNTVMPTVPVLNRLLSSSHQTVDRFKTQLSAFNQAPWTLQRLCELVLEPRKQYRLLHKVRFTRLKGWRDRITPHFRPDHALCTINQVALAIEKCLAVTSEVAPHPSPPPAPLLSDLGAVNSNPPPIYAPEGATEGGAAAGRPPHRTDADDEASAAFTGSLLELRPAAATAEAPGSSGAAAAAAPVAGGGSPNSKQAGHHHTGNHMEHIEVRPAGVIRDPLRRRDEGIFIVRHSDPFPVFLLMALSLCTQRAGGPLARGEARAGPQSLPYASRQSRKHSDAASHCIFSWPNPILPLPLPQPDQMVNLPLPLQSPPRSPLPAPHNLLTSIPHGGSPQPRRTSPIATLPSLQDHHQTASNVVVAAVAACVAKGPEDGPLGAGGVPGGDSGAMDMEVEVEASGQEEGQAMQE